VKKHIGSGSLISLWLGEHARSGIQVVIRAFAVDSASDRDTRTRFVRETSLMKQRDHCFVCKRQTPITPFQRDPSASEYLDSERMVAHGDVKAENILLDAYFNIGLIAFDLIHAFSQSQPHLHAASGRPSACKARPVLT
jgi:serine/threonine protein kinase